jgi:hypothetical protein
LLEQTATRWVPLVEPTLDAASRCLIEHTEIERRVHANWMGCSSRTLQAGERLEREVERR